MFDSFNRHGGVILLQFKNFKFYSLTYFSYFSLLGVILIVLYGWLGFSDWKISCEFTIKYLSVLISLFFITNDKSWVSILLKILYFFSIFYTLTTIWLYFDTNSYFKYFADNLYPNNVNYNFYNGYVQGYTAGVTDHYSTNGMMLANAIICFFSFTIIKIKNKRFSIVSTIFLILSIIAMVLTGKRAHLLFSIVAIAVGTLLFLSKDKNKGIKYVSLILILVIVGTIVLNTSERLQNVLARFENMSEDGNITSRFEFWGKAIELFKENKLTGIGWMHFYYEGGFDQAVHNSYIQILCEAGLIGVIIFFPLFIYNFVINMKIFLIVAKNKKNISRTTLMMTCFSFCYQIYFLLYCLTGNPLFDIYCYGLYYIGSFVCVSYYKEYMVKNNIPFFSFGKKRLC